MGLALGDVAVEVEPGRAAEFVTDTDAREAVSGTPLGVEAGNHVAHHHGALVDFTVGGDGAPSVAVYIDAEIFPAALLTDATFLVTGVVNAAYDGIGLVHDSCSPAAVSFR